MTTLTEAPQPLTSARQAILHSQAERLPNRYGRARRRQTRRQRMKTWLGGIIRLAALVWLMMGILLPLVVYRAASTQAARAIDSRQRLLGAHRSSSIALSIGLPAASPTIIPASPTSTPSPSPTVTPTPTPLPAYLVQATAWQATLDQAVIHSRATQTLAAGQYAATQTALPPILTANALDRSATSTAAEWLLQK